MDRDAPATADIGDALRDRDETLAVAESCTGGLLGSALTDVAGSSDYFVGGVVAYTDRTKRRLLAVPRESLERHGAVSEPVASAMAHSVREKGGADWGVSTTGYAGPTRGDADVPVGTAYLGIAYGGRDGAADDSEVDEGAAIDGADADSFAVVERHRFDGSRKEVKERIVEQALASALDRVQSVS